MIGSNPAWTANFANSTIQGMQGTLPQASAVSFVLPVHNEEANLQLLYEKIRDVCRQEQIEYEIIFIDDGSQDASFSVLTEICKNDARVRALQFRRNFGQTAAMSAGIHESTAPIIITMDADLQNDPADVPRLLSALHDGFDVVSGWRQKRQDSWLKRWPSKWANSIISRVTGIRLSDYGCSLKAYRREYLQLVPLYGDMHRFIPVFAAWYGAKICEISVAHHPRTHGKSHYGVVFRTGRVMLDLLTVKFLHTYISRPMHFFGAIGAVLLGLGSLSFLTAIIFKLTHFRDFVATPLPMFSVFLITIGLQSLLLGLLAELLIRIYFEQPGRKSYRIAKVVGQASSHA